MKSFIAVDGGGTKTETLLVDVNGKIYSRNLIGCSNPNDVGMEDACNYLSIELKRLIKVSEDNHLELSGIFLLIAGIEFGDSKEVLKKELIKRINYDNLFVDGDLASVKEAGLAKDNQGVVVISGTGFNMAIKNHDKFVNIGGWGYMADVYLSGFNLGKEALSYCSRAINGVGEKTLLVELIEKRFNHSLWYSMAEIYQGGVKTVASISKEVIAAYLAKDKVARKIVDERIDDLARIIKSKTKELDKPIKVCLFGGIFENNKFICDCLANKLKKGYVVNITDKKTIYGAVYFGIKKVLKEVSDKFYLQFDEEYKRY